MSQTPPNQPATMEPLSTETEAAVTALEDARQELVTEEGFVAHEPGTPPEDGFVLNHQRVVKRIDAALEPFEGKYEMTIYPGEQCGLPGQGVSNTGRQIKPHEEDFPNGDEEDREGYIGPDRRGQEAPIPSSDQKD